MTLPLAPGDEIRVAQGTYKPDQGGGYTAGDRTRSFVIKNGVQVLGGYAGYDAPDPDLRVPDQFVTTLSGDLLGNDGPNFANYADNSYHVVDVPVTTVTSPPFETRLDGFTTLGGNATIASFPAAGGIRIGSVTPSTAASPIVSSCTIKLNSANQSGGGIWITSPVGASPPSTPEIRNCLVAQNRAGIASVVGEGGGLRSDRSDTRLLHSTFRANTLPEAENLDYMGAGVHLRMGKPRLVSCTIEANKGSVGAGVAIVDHVPSPPDPYTRLLNCAIFENEAELGGGGVYVEKSVVKLVNCTIGGNEARGTDPSLGGGGGGGYYQYAHAEHVADLIGCILWGNTSNTSDAGQIYVEGAEGASTVDISFTDVQGGLAGIGGSGNIIWDAVTNLAVDPLFGAPPASYRLRTASPCRDAGDDGAIEDDTFDVDEDMVTEEDTPDADLGLRIRDAAADMGAYEHVEPCPLDLDGDQLIGFGELLLILSEWGPCPPPPPACVADVNADGIVGFQDLLLILANWGPCADPGSADPPQSIVDCMQRFANSPANLEKCIEAMILAGTP